MTLSNITDWWALPGTSGPAGIIAGFAVLLFVGWLLDKLMDNDDDKTGTSL